jgi:pantothenate kinase
VHWATRRCWWVWTGFISPIPNCAGWGDWPDTFDVDGYVALLTRIRGQVSEVVYAPEFDRSLEASIGGAVPVPRRTPLVITEGNYLLHDEHGWQAVAGLLDEVWFLDVPVHERRERLIRRRRSFGEPLAAARAWVHEVDEVNAAVVDGTVGGAALVVRVATSSQVPELITTGFADEGVVQ